MRLGDLLDADNGRFVDAFAKTIGALPQVSSAHRELSEEFLNTTVEAVGNTVVYSTGTAVWNKNMITICSVLASLSSSLLAFFKFQEKWILYRSTAETMKKELALYRAKQINNQCLEQLITELENCMSKERAEWFLSSYILAFFKPSR